MSEEPTDYCLSFLSPCIALPLSFVIANESKVSLVFILRMEHCLDKPTKGIQFVSLEQMCYSG
jgi:hypothetical protein